MVANFDVHDILAGGHTSATITVVATDLDGLIATAVLSVVVNVPYFTAPLGSR